MVDSFLKLADNNDGDTPLRGSPAAQRTVAILDFFADHPRESFTLTEVARALRISTATCLNFLSTLVSANYLSRDSSKRYALGPALGRLADAAAQRGGPLQLAKSVMRELADRYDVICSAIFPEAGEAVVRERASSLSHLGWAAQLGKRFPLSPPFGTVFFAWNTPREIERWLASTADRREAIDPERIHASLAFARKVGFATGLRTERLKDQAHAQSLTYRADKTDYLVTELDEAKTYDLAFASAPIFDETGQVAFALAVMGFTKRLTGAQILEIGDQLRRACDQVTKASGGQPVTP
ncbi:IclR family transcriptional regulator [Novosphingobium pentaromativorans]|uniref:IclR family transcriptional regulator n=1 Tax=Novosphingobium pentaromativorans US6-1 TaxID=1088721 RepID=G6EAZ7_9SPHN|nr:helix-turn-helix domain-containing protein [Novosphingobium pentaromativorans]EHJ61464.1 hypothetical protein NSU_1518 [Novosphingobium pentaromativorans US6-1]